jgi:uncharacterized protein
MIKRLLLFITILSIAISVLGQQITDYSVVVEGNASVEQVPEMVVFSASFSLSDVNYATCVNNTLLTIAEVKNDLQKLKFEGSLLKTENFNVSPEYEWDNEGRKQVFKGYKAVQNIELKIKFQKELVDKIFYTFNERLKSSYTVSFELSDQQRIDQKKILLDLAIADATEKANQIASTSKIKLGRVSGVKYTSNTPLLFDGHEAQSLQKSVIQTSMLIPQVAGSLTPRLVKLTTNIIMIWDIEEPEVENTNNN